MATKHQPPEAGLPDGIEDKKKEAETWFQEIRDTICQNFEDLEDALEGPFSEHQPGRFEREDWLRNNGDGGGGTKSIMRGRVFEKVGIHTSTVHGRLPDDFKEQIPMGFKPPRFLEKDDVVTIAIEPIGILQNPVA